MPVIHVTFEGAKELRKKLADPRVIMGPLNTLLKRASNEGQDVAKQAIKGGTEYAMQSILTTVQPLYARVFTTMPQVRALSIEQGRAAGQAPSLLAVARWITGRRYLTGYRLETLTKQERSAVVKAQKAIREHGAKAKRYIGTAAERVKAIMPELVQDMARDVEEMLK